LFVLIPLASAGQTPKTDLVGSLAGCDPLPLATVEGWREIQQRDGFSLLLPTCFQETEGPRYVHGGVRWSCGDAAVEVVWGMWGLSESAESRTTCGTTLAGLPAMVTVDRAEDRLGVRVWYVTGGIHEPLVVTRSASADDMPMLAAIAQSGRLSKPQGPNR
jgi:hypothetical protein